ncbi:hypothetical protein GGI07_004183 [Coemansia sp. Benny D115]|nr:hypothetical protein GGI07_004183 [Coemansia sp. Benny D115]
MNNSDSANTPEAFLARVFTAQSPPRVTLTFAQSLDGKISSRPGAALQLSGAESLKMTHVMRTLHSGILVGVGTVLADNPRLTARLAPQPAQHPRPVILDTHLRTPPDARVFDHPCSPILVAAPGCCVERRRVLEARGAEVVVVDRCDADGRPRLDAVVEDLRARGIDSLMVEGGARVIQAFLRHGELVDALVITIAPVLVGPEGVAAVPSMEGIGTMRIEPQLYQQLGADIVMAADVV